MGFVGLLFFLAQPSVFTLTVPCVKYDIWGNTTSTNVGYIDTKGTTATTDDVFVGNDLATYEYASKNGNLKSMTYGNGAVVSYTYDMFDRIKTETHKDLNDSNVLEELYTNTYYYNGDGSLGRVEKTVDNAVESIIYYTYDGIGRVLEVCEYEGDTLLNRQSYGYDDINRTDKATVQAGTNKVESTYTYDEIDGKVLKLINHYTVPELDRNHGFDYTYDYLKRLTSKKLTHHYANLTASYGYADNQSNSTYASTLINSLDYTASSATGNIFTFDYTYDNLGNIKQAVSGGEYNRIAGTSKYFYDKQNQLVMEVNSVAGKTYLYEYDTYGNIRKKYTINATNFDSYEDVTDNLTFIYDYTVDTYTYGDAEWKDQLTGYNGHAITYDEIGNPLDYYNGRIYGFEWKDGRKMSYTFTAEADIYYDYNTSGLRTSKTVENYYGGVYTTEYTYHYAGDMLISQTWDDQSLNFFYDENGSVYGFVYDDGIIVKPYYYIKNLQGDVIGIMDENGYVEGIYSYDAWGNVVAITNQVGVDITGLTDEIANINPIRYRSYYYDAETGFYYLQSRYYDPYTGRFINADSYGSTGQGFVGYNMYAYCNNNPINMKDSSGYCGKFLGFLWKTDCKSSTCPTSKKYVKPVPPVSSSGTYKNKKDKPIGDVYIVQPEQLDDMNKSKEKNDVVIVDNRTGKNPSMQVQNSYKISDKKQQEQICQILYVYNKDNPVDPAWYRTVDSMLIEWKAHNDGYSCRLVIGMFKENASERLRHVDFDNEAEELEYWDFLKK